MNSLCCCQSKCVKDKQGDSQNKIQPISEEIQTHPNNNTDVTNSKDAQSVQEKNRHAIIKTKKRGDQNSDDNRNVYKKEANSDFSTENKTCSESISANKNPIIDESLLRPIVEENDEINLSQCENKNILQQDSRNSTFSEALNCNRSGKNNNDNFVKAQNTLNNSKISVNKKSKKKVGLPGSRQVKDGISIEQDTSGQGTKYINNISNINLTFNNTLPPNEKSDKKIVKTQKLKKSKKNSGSRSSKLDLTQEKESNSSTANILLDSNPFIDSNQTNPNSNKFTNHEDSSIKITDFKESSGSNVNRDLLDQLKDKNEKINESESPVNLKMKTQSSIGSKEAKTDEFMDSKNVHGQIQRALTWMTQIEEFYNDSDLFPYLNSKETEKDTQKFEIDSTNTIEKMNITTSFIGNKTNNNDLIDANAKELNEEILDISQMINKKKNQKNIPEQNNNYTTEKKTSCRSESNVNHKSPVTNLQSPSNKKKVTENLEPAPRLSVIKEQVDKELLKKLGFDQSDPSSESEETERKITALSQRAIFGYYFSFVEQDVIEKERNLRPRFRRYSSSNFDYPVYYEYLQETIDKRQHIFGRILKAALNDPGWLVYIELYKIALKKLEIQNCLLRIQKEELKPKIEINEEIELMKSEVLQQEEVMDPTIKIATSKNLNEPIIYDTKKKRKGLSELEFKHQANITDNSRKKKFTRLTEEAEFEIKFGKEFILEYKKFKLYNKVTYQDFVITAEELYKKEFIDNKFVKKRFSNFENWVTFKAEQYLEFDLAQFEQNMLEMQMMGDFVLNLADSFSQGQRQTMNFFLCKKEKDVFTNSMSGYYQKYCLIQRYLDLYIIDPKKELVHEVLLFAENGQKFINEKLYDKNKDDIKIEAINDVLFAQKICEVYYKDYRRGDMNFFGVLQNILKFRTERSNLFNMRVEFYDMRKKSEVKAHRDGFSYDSFVQNVTELKALRIQLIKEINEKSKFDEKKYALYKAVFFIVRDNLPFIILEDQRTQKFGQVKDIVISEVAFGDEFNKIVVDYHENYIKTVVDLSLRIKELSTEINFWQEFDELYKTDDIEKIKKNELLDSQLCIHTKKNTANFIARYLNKMLEKQNTVEVEENDSIKEKTKEIEDVKYKMFKRVATVKDFEYEESSKAQDNKPIISTFGKAAKDRTLKQLNSPKKNIVESTIFDNNQALSKIDEKNELDYADNNDSSISRSKIGAKKDIINMSSFGYGDKSEIQNNKSQIGKTSIDNSKIYAKNKPDYGEKSEIQCHNSLDKALDYKGEIQITKSQLGKTYIEKSKIDAKNELEYLDKSEIQLSKSQLDKTFIEKSRINAKTELEYLNKSEIQITKSQLGKSFIERSKIIEKNELENLDEGDTHESRSNVYKTPTKKSRVDEQTELDYGENCEIQNSDTKLSKTPIETSKVIERNEVEYENEGDIQNNRSKICKTPSNKSKIHEI